jgi:hypothetical protein
MFKGPIQEAHAAPQERKMLLKSSRMLAAGAPMSMVANVIASLNYGRFL